MSDETDITIVIADDHAVIRRGLRLLLEEEPDLRVVAEAGDVPGTLRAVETARPRVALLDLNMPGGSSLEAIARLRARAPETAVVVLTMESDPAIARRAIQNGALGFVLKEAADDELLDAIRRAAVGQTYLNPRVGARLAAEPAPAQATELTTRETEILRRIALGYTNAEIAAELELSVRTVETHRAHVQQKLHRTSRAELVQYALAHKLVTT